MSIGTRALALVAIVVRRLGLPCAAAAVATVVVAAPASADRPSPFPPCKRNPNAQSLFDCPRPAAPPAQSQSTSRATFSPGPPVARSAPRPVFVPNVLIVRLRAHTTSADVSSLVRRLHVQVKRRIPQLREATLFVPPERRSEVLGALRRSPLVAGFARDAILRLTGLSANDTFFADQWGLQAARFTTAWERTTGAPVVVAVVDTGVDASQPDLAGAVLPGVDLVSGTATAADDNGHGTATAGVIAARGDNAIGGAGVCWSCRILPVKVLGRDGSGDLATVAAGIVRATDLGARVINLSLGGPAGLDLLEQAIAYANGKGAVVVAAAGNTGLSSPFFPAAYPQAISVAGTDPRNELYPWSQRGSWIDVSAPGCNVAPLLAGGYGEFCGTSSATPLVAGLAALILSVDPTATQAQVATAIEQGAVKSGSTGFGRIDAVASLAAVGAAPVSRTTRLLTGTLAPSRRSWRYSLPLASGPFVATLRVRGTTRMRLAVRGPSLARTVRTVGGHAALAGSIGTGVARVAVTGRPRRRTRFTLVLTYVAR